MVVPVFEAGRSAPDAHRSLQRCVGIKDRAKHEAVLWFGEIMKRRLYKDLGYSSIFQYASEELGFSSSRTGDFKRLAEKLDGLPRIKAQVASGALGYTKAREVVKVAAPETEAAWLDLAARQSRRQLEVTVKRARAKSPTGQADLIPAADPAPPPATRRVSFELSPTQYARFEALLARIVPGTDRGELLLEMMEEHLAGQDSPRGESGPRTQIHVHECPTCARATVETTLGSVDLQPEEAEAARCDARVSRPGRPNRATVPPRVRRQILARDRHRCRRKGCNHKNFLDIHHLVPRARGGTNDPTNLVTLCSACHRLAHRRGMDPGPLLDVIHSPQDHEPKAASPPCSKRPART